MRVLEAEISKIYEMRSRIQTVMVSVTDILKIFRDREGN
jgi:hypothetical protein